MLGGGETHVYQDICDEVLPVLGRSPHAVQCFVNELGVVRTGVRITEGWANNGDLIVWD